MKKNAGIGGAWGRGARTKGAMFLFIHVLFITGSPKLSHCNRIMTVAQAA